MADTTWTSKTNQFGSGELNMIKNMPADQLAGAIVASPPVVALRVVAEVMLNGDGEKLQALLENEEVNSRWQDFQNDYGVDHRDHEYAEQLQSRLK